MSTDYIRARKSQYHFYIAVPLFTKIDGQKFVLYKPPGTSLGQMRVSDSKHPEALFIKKDDKINGIKEAQEAFNRRLETNIKSGSLEKVKETLVTIMAETLTEPRSGSLEGVSQTVDILAEYSTESDVMDNLLAVSTKDYSTIMHSINIMAFSLSFGIYQGFSKPDLKDLGLAALLHDVGKTKINPEILTAARRLTKEEFAEMQSHSIIGYNILKSCKFKCKEIRMGALDHHEKLDKSGYPNGKSNISEVSQILGIIDCYEALTNDDRPYRNAMEPYEALQLIKEDAMEGKFNKSIFEKFAHSLTR